MLYIGSHVSLDDKSLIEYFIEGVPDARLNKATLFQSKSIRELKENSLVYENIRNAQRYPNESYDERAMQNVKEEKNAVEKHRSVLNTEANHIFLGTVSQENLYGSNVKDQDINLLSVPSRDNRNLMKDANKYG